MKGKLNLRGAFREGTFVAVQDLSRKDRHI